MSLDLDAMAAAELATKSTSMDVVQEALGRTESDAGALFEPSVIDAIHKVRKVSVADWQRIRAKAKAVKADTTELERLTRPAKGEAEAEAEGGMFPHINHWPEPVNGAELISDMVKAIRSHVIAEEPTFLAAALWSLHTYAVDIWTISPIAHIKAAERRCGKSVLLNTIKKLAYRPLSTGNISAAALYRCVEKWNPCLLIDEADSFMKENEDMRNVICAGLYNDPDSPDGVVRYDADANMVRMFTVFCPKLLCGIGSLPATIEDRAIPLILRRKLPNETTSNLRHSDKQTWGDLRSRAKRWIDDNREELQRLSVRSIQVAGLHDRSNDIWEPMLAIADCAGVGMEARAAAQALHKVEGDEQLSVNTELLRDVRDTFTLQSASFLSTKRLCQLLIEDEELSWATYGWKGLTVKAMTNKLADYGVKPEQQKTGKRERGFYLKDFADAFARFLPVDSGEASAHPFPNPDKPHGSDICGTHASFSTFVPNGSQVFGDSDQERSIRTDRPVLNGLASGSKAPEAVGTAQSARMNGSNGGMPECPF
jgi:hypothetical protein